jgi:hypothetical protein
MCKKPAEAGQGGKRGLEMKIGADVEPGLGKGIPPGKQRVNPGQSI